MPYYQWQGITLEGVIKRGAIVSLDEVSLEKELLASNIALLNYKQKKIFFPKKWRAKHKHYFIFHVAQLVKKGIPLPEAVILTAQGFSNASRKLVVIAIARQLQEGNSFPKALANSCIDFHPFIIASISAGQESGNLIHALEDIAYTVQMQAMCYGQLKSIIIMPLITFFFFGLLLLFILVVIIPQFVAIYATMQQKIPAFIVFFLMIGNFLKSRFGIILFGSFIFGIWFFIRFITLRKKEILERLYMVLPLIGTLYKIQLQAYFFNALALQLAVGVPLMNALGSLKEGAHNTVLYSLCQQLQAAIAQGASFHNALEQIKYFFYPQTIALIKSGEESGNLALICKQIAKESQMKLQAKLIQLPVILQPVMIIFLGILIGVLVCSLYIPLFSISVYL